MNAIEVRDLSKTYQIYDDPGKRLLDVLGMSRKNHGREFAALQDISFTLEKGKTLGIIGENGAGKSTLLKVLTGVLQPTAGSMVIHGKISALLELGTGFNMEYTGIENIYLSGNVNGIPREEIDRRVPDIVAFADIGDFIDRKVKTYSSGMFARLAFAVAVHIEPEILIVDEALSVGDLFFQQKCNMYMKERMRDCTKLLVTHDMASIANMADEVIVLQKGRQIFYGDPLQAIELYTKNIHTNLYKGKQEETLCEDSRADTVQPEGMTEIDRQKLGGALDATIDSYRVNINGKPYIGYVQNDDEVAVWMQISARRRIDRVIVGYQIKDKYGNTIFGENTHSSGFAESVIEAGKQYIAQISFRWPQIQENTYFLTLGIGEGNHEMQHIIQCWAHNIFELQNITNLPDHGIFNQKLDGFRLMEVE